MELLVAMALGTVIVGGPLTFMIYTLNQQNAVSSRSYATSQAEVGLAKLTRDLRQIVPGTAVTFTWDSAPGSTDSAAFTLPVPGTQGASNETVTWNCNTGAAQPTCTRQVGSGPAVDEIEGVTSLTFAPVDQSGNAIASGTGSSDVAYVQVQLQVADVSQNDANRTAVLSSGSPITLEDGVDLRSNAS